MSLDPALLDILACPDAHHAPLTYDSGAQTLTCVECGRVFPIRDGIPVLLLDEATAPATQAAPAQQTMPATQATAAQQTMPATQATAAQQTMPATQAATETDR